MDELVKIKDVNEESEIQSLGERVKAYAQSIVILDDASYVEAVRSRATAKDIARKTEEFFKPIKAAAYNAHKTITQRESELIKSINEGIATLDEKIIEYRGEAEVPHVDSVQYRETVDVVIDDVSAFLMWALSERRLDYVLPNEKALREYARSAGSYYDVPGTRRITKTTIVQGR